MTGLAIATTAYLVVGLLLASVAAAVIKWGDKIRESPGSGNEERVAAAEIQQAMKGLPLAFIMVGLVIAWPLVVAKAWHSR